MPALYRRLTMKLTSFKSVALLFALLPACVASVEHDGDRRDGSSEEWSSDEPRIDGIPCSHLRGEVTLSEYDGDNFASSSFSFEFASQDPEITYNDYDLLYERNTFRVNLSGGDDSFIVDLGDVPLADVPETVDAADYPVGAFGEHDEIGAVIDHTYFVRTDDDTGRVVAAFRVVGLEPGVRATISWIRSTDPDRMVVPVDCGT
jgi:hypothetical protein